MQRPVRSGLARQPSSGCGRHVKYFHFEFQTALIVSAPAFFTRPDTHQIPSAFSGANWVNPKRARKPRGRSAARRVRPSSPPCGGKHLTALQLGDFGLRVRTSGDQRTGACPLTSKRTSSLLQGGGSISAHGRIPLASRSRGYEPQQRAPIPLRMQARLQTCPSEERDGSGSV